MSCLTRTDKKEKRERRGKGTASCSTGISSETPYAPSSDPGANKDKDTTSTLRKEKRKKGKGSLPPSGRAAEKRIGSKKNAHSVHNTPLHLVRGRREGKTREGIRFFVCRCDEDKWE